MTERREAQEDSKAIHDGCPVCSERVYWHSLSIWCMRCDWGKNRAGVKK